MKNRPTNKKVTRTWIIKKDILTDMEGSGWLNRKTRIISKEDVSPNKFATFALKRFCSWAHAILQFGFHSNYIA